MSRSHRPFPVSNTIRRITPPSGAALDHSKISPLTIPTATTTASLSHPPHQSPCSNRRPCRIPTAPPFSTRSTQARDPASRSPNRAAGRPRHVPEHVNRADTNSPFGSRPSPRLGWCHFLPRRHMAHWKKTRGQEGTGARGIKPLAPRRQPSSLDAGCGRLRGDRGGRFAEGGKRGRVGTGWWEMDASMASRWSGVTDGVCGLFRVWVVMSSSLRSAPFDLLRMRGDVEG